MWLFIATPKSSQTKQTGINNVKAKGWRSTRASEEKGRRPTGQDFQIPRGENKQAYHLAKAASAEHMIVLDKVLSFVQFSPLIDLVDV